MESSKGLLTHRDSVPNLEGHSTSDIPEQPRLSPRLDRDRFVESLRHTKVADLASRYNNGKECRVFHRLYGSFNVCFFVEFEECGTLWAVRIPIEPRLHKPWEKLQSEATTLKYVRANTKIPVPAVHAVGNDAILTDDGTKRQMFLISDLILGNPLTNDRLQQLAEADEATQRRFFLQLIGYLQDLRNLEFPAIGSLMPGTGDKPIVGDILSFSADKYQLTLPSCTSAKTYMSSQYDLLVRHVAEPAPDFSVADCRYELFALHTLREPFREFLQGPKEAGPFVLHHPDLQPCNILVDQELRITGIVDWEFAHTIPLQLFTPPLWVIYPKQNLQQLCFLFVRTLFSQLQYEELRQQWYDGSKFNLDFFFARLIRHPGDLVAAFAEYLQKHLKSDAVKAESDFFERHPEVAVEAEQKALRNVSMANVSQGT
ncbi:phosphotransferase enzyme family protein [Cordyceps javanica]|uniref:Phosphotransferase enzyme family protein n=1 Tax=Cordyceps javanica TaxID=43265 RepID=A0A545UVJ4_9HYPO|nr:phosphotransferase enzyme family protein [Cordyceps javanica]TQW05178.1 phosphotransferase enzyme family protein [Cordyceps javanica]